VNHFLMLNVFIAFPFQLLDQWWSSACRERGLLTRSRVSQLLSKWREAPLIELTVRMIGLRKPHYGTGAISRSQILARE